MENSSTNPLPKRERQRPPTHKGIPHSQLGVQPVPEINEALFRLAFSLPDVLNRPTTISVPGARALWLADSVTPAHPEALVSGREFAHIHPDGSLHVALSAERAVEAFSKGWAEPHPAGRYLGINGLVMLYTPQDQPELDVVWQLIVESYNYVTGRDLVPEMTTLSTEGGEA